LNFEFTCPPKFCLPAANFFEIWAGAGKGFGILNFEFLISFALCAVVLRFELCALR